METNDKELANKDHKYKVARYKDDLESLYQTARPVGAILLVMFMGCFYFVPQLLKNRQWFLLGIFVILGFVFYKVSEILKKYESLLKQTISDLEVSKRLKDIDRK